MEKEHLFPTASPAEGEAFTDDMQGNQTLIGQFQRNSRNRKPKLLLKAASSILVLGYRMIALLLFFH